MFSLSTETSGSPLPIQKRVSADQIPGPLASGGTKVEAWPTDTRAAVRGASVYKTRASQIERLNASSVSQEEEIAWNEERVTLLKRKMQTGLSKEDIIRLEFVRWNLHRIEDARARPALDNITRAINQYKSLLSEIVELRKEFDVQAISTHRKR